MSKEAMKPVLDALENLRTTPQWAHTAIGIRSVIDAQIAAIEALASEALEQPAPATPVREQEPVARILSYQEMADAAKRYTSPQPAQQEPVAWMYDWICDGKVIEGWIAHKEAEIPRSLASNIHPLYTSPPAQRKPLTNDEIGKAFKEAMTRRPKDASNAETNRLFVRAIEAAHGIKAAA